MDLEKRLQALNKLQAFLSSWAQAHETFKQNRIIAGIPAIGIAQSLRSAQLLARKFENCSVSQLGQESALVFVARLGDETATETIWFQDPDSISGAQRRLTLTLETLSRRLARNQTPETQEAAHSTQKLPSGARMSGEPPSEAQVGDMRKRFARHP